MKKFLVVVFLLALASCGKTDKIYTPDYKGQIDDNTARIEALEKSLEQAYKDLDSLRLYIGRIEEFNQDTLSDLVESNLTRIIELENALQDQSNVITEIIDPCGDNIGQFDEVLFQLKDKNDKKTIIGYFEQGNKHFLSTLPDGNYRTTDDQACNFTIFNGEVQ